MRQYPTGSLLKTHGAHELPKLVDKGLHGRSDKWLIYDGQQRLQMLYSCLKHTFNEKILIYDLLFDLNATHDPDETGFLFVPKNTDIDWHFIRMNMLFSKASL